jgi:hypothetical protein
VKGDEEKALDSATLGAMKDGISNRDEFVAYVQELRKDFLANGAAWENQDIPSFLDGLAEWVQYGMDGSYHNQGIPMPEKPDWIDFARILTAARVFG